MSTFNLAKKLHPATKAWKSFKKHLQSKLCHNPNFFNAIITIRHRCTAARRSIFPFIHKKILALTRRSPPHSRRRHPSNSAVYVDELFPGAVSLAEPRKNIENMDESRIRTPVNKSRPENAQTRKVEKVTSRIPDEKVENVEKGKAKASECADKWKIASLPQFRGIDERAEEFIAKFRQDMKLEREQSLLDFEEMLKRSA